MVMFSDDLRWRRVRRHDRGRSYIDIASYTWTLVMIGQLSRSFTAASMLSAFTIEYPTAPISRVSSRVPDGVTSRPSPKGLPPSTMWSLIDANHLVQPSMISCVGSQYP